MYEDTDRFENWFITSLQTSITDTTNSFRLNKALNVNQCRLVIDPYDESLREIVQVTSVDGDLVYVNRGDDHTDPQYHQEGAIVALHVFAADLNDLYADWDKFQTELQEAIDDANDAALAANNAASAAEDATDLANAATLAANNAADSATSAASSATMAAGLANTATTNANNAADSANSAAGDANDAAIAANAIVDDYEAYADSIVDTAIESYILDEDDMASDDATKVPSQQSVKAYVDTAVAIDDTGWQEAVLSGNVVLYDNGVPVIYRRWGNVVEVRGAVKPANSGAVSAGGGDILTLPTGFRPSNFTVYTRQQGSGSKGWMLSVNSAGLLRWERYDGTLATSTWLPFQVTFITDDAFPGGE